MMRRRTPPRNDYLIKIIELRGDGAAKPQSYHALCPWLTQATRALPFNVRGARITVRMLCKDGPAKILRMDFCTQNRFNFRFRPATPFLQPEHGT